MNADRRWRRLQAERRIIDDLPEVMRATFGIGMMRPFRQGVDFKGDRLHRRIFGVFGVIETDQVKRKVTRVAEVDEALCPFV